MIIRILLILVFITIHHSPFTIHQAFAQDPKEEEALFVARKAFDDGFYDVSLGLLERFKKNFADSDKLTQVDLLIGQCFFHQNKFLDALAKFEELLTQPEVGELKDAVFYWIAEVHFRGNSFDKAAGYYRKIIDGYPESAFLSAAYYSLGWSAFQEQDFAEALKHFERVENDYPDEPEFADVAFKIVECFYSLKDYTTLKVRLKSYLKKYAHEPVRLSYLYFYLAESDYYLDNFDQAINEYKNSLAKTNDDKIKALSKLGMGWSFLKLERYQEAEDIFGRIKEENLEKRSLQALLLGRAILMVETEKISEAKKIYDELLNLATEPSVLIQAYLGKAEALYNLAEYEEAVRVYKEALDRVDPEYITREMIDKLHYSLAWTYLKQGEFKEAIKEFQGIVKTSDDMIFKVSALCQIGDTYQDSGDYDKAEETYDRILKDYPDSFYSDYVQYQLGLSLLKASNYSGAIMAFWSLKRNYPVSKLLDDATYALGLAYFQNQDYNSSREIFAEFQEEFKESSLSPQAMYLLGTSLYNLADYSAAIEIFKKIAKVYSKDIELVQKAEYEIADCFYQLGDEKEAMKRFEVLRSKYPDSTLSAEIMWWLGEYYYRHNDLVQARRYFSSLIKDFPRSNLIVDAYYVLGSSFAEESSYSDAIKNFKKVIKFGKADLAGQAAVAIADIYVKEDKPNLAIGAYKDIIRGYPKINYLVYPKMADFFYDTDDFSQALYFYRKSLDLVPVKEMAGIQLKIADALSAQGKTTEAIEEYLKVTYLYSENSLLAVKAFLRVAQIYESKENFKEAVNIYRKVVSMEVEEAKYAQERVDWIEKYVK